jgi:hypothetical protein
MRKTFCGTVGYAAGLEFYDWLKMDIRQKQRVKEERKRQKRK